MLSRGLIAVLKGRISPRPSTTCSASCVGPRRAALRRVANRMITRDPDITRLLDRLEKRGLISRNRETKDRRMVMARITPPGLECWPPG